MHLMPETAVACHFAPACVASALPIALEPLELEHWRSLALVHGLALVQIVAALASLPNVAYSILETDEEGGQMNPPSTNLDRQTWPTQCYYSELTVPQLVD